MLHFWRCRVVSPGVARLARPRPRTKREVGRISAAACWQLRKPGRGYDPWAWARSWILCRRSWAGSVGGGVKRGMRARANLGRRHSVRLVWRTRSTPPLLRGRHLQRGGVAQAQRRAQPATSPSAFDPAASRGGARRAATGGAEGLHGGRQWNARGVPARRVCGCPTIAACFSSSRRARSAAGERAPQPRLPSAPLTGRWVLRDSNYPADYLQDRRRPRIRLETVARGSGVIARPAPAERT